MKIDRLISIVMILLEKKRVSAAELAEKFEVSKRTIYRDIDTINMAGIPILSTTGVGGGIEIMPGYKLDKNVFSESDLSTLLSGLYGLSNMVHGDELIHTLTKVKSFIPPEQANRIEASAEQICIDPHPWIGNRSIGHHLEVIHKSIRACHTLEMTYLNQKGNCQERTIEPYQLVSKNNAWYVWGYCYYRNDYRMFKLARIIKLTADETARFIPRDFKKPQLNIDDMVSNLQTRVTLRVHHSLLERILDYCPFERITRVSETHYLVDFPFIENDYHYDLLLGFGDRCEVIEPAGIRQNLRRRVQSLAKIYNC